MRGQTPSRVHLDRVLAADPAGALLWGMVALMGYFAAIGGIVLVLLSDDIGEWDRALGHSLTVQIPAEASAVRVETSLALLRQTAGIRAVRLLEAAETARLLEPWLGPPAAITTLPVPRLVDVQIDPDAAIDFADLRQKLSSIVPGAEIDDHREWRDTSRSAESRVASLLEVAIAAIAGLLVVFAVYLTRGRLAVQGETIELLHQIGAADADVAWPFQADALRRGLLGGGIGAAAALVSLVAVVGILPRHATTASSGFTDWRLWGVAIAVTLAAGLVAITVARITVLRRLALMP